MPKYLFEVSYSMEGMRGIMEQGAANRAAFISEMSKGLGGNIESFNFAFGETDAFVIGELPDDETAAAIAMAVGASGAASISTVKLLTPEQIDRARGIKTGWKPPGT